MSSSVGSASTRTGTRSGRFSSACSTRTAISISLDTAPGFQTPTGLRSSIVSWSCERRRAFDAAARAPGAPSRWSSGKEDNSWVPVQPGVVVEVSYDQLEGDRFRHASRFHRWRPDKDAEQCTMDQLERPEGAGFREVVDG